MENKKFDKIAYNNKFINKTYDRINLTMPKGKKDIVKQQRPNYGGECKQLY